MPSRPSQVSRNEPLGILRELAVGRDVDDAELGLVELGFDPRHLELLVEQDLAPVERVDPAELRGHVRERREALTG